MRNISLVVAYDGTNYHGWQCQPNALTVQETLEGTVGRILDHAVKLYAGGRTDAGVHAMGQVVNFFTPKDIGLEGLTRGINSLLPVDIRVRDAAEVGEGFHARYSARSKTYVYTILNHPYNSPFLARYALHVPYELDAASMDTALRLILGEHDFSAFKKKDEHYRSTVREVRRAWVRRQGRVIYVAVEATGFLRYMVRNIVGTLLLVGHGKLCVDAFGDIFDSCEREKAGPTAPPHGLFLRKIFY